MSEFGYINCASGEALRLKNRTHLSVFQDRFDQSQPHNIGVICLGKQ
jgi:hypothetical protein